MANASKGYDIMQTLSLPSRQIYRYVLTGKFKAPSSQWKHERSPLFEYELIVMTEGTLYLTYDRKDFTVSSGEYLLLPPSDSCREGFRSSCCSFYWLHFSLDALYNASVFFTLPQQGKMPRLEKMVILMKQLQDMVKNQYPAVSIDMTATCVLTELYGQISLNLPFDPENQLHKQIYSDIIGYIKRNINRNIKISEIAKEFNYNAKYIGHHFSQITGIPLKQFILNQKIDAANFMLTDSNKSIDDIAMELGFSSGHNFSRTYKKMTGLTPSEYRNAYAKRLLYHQ